MAEDYGWVDEILAKGGTVDDVKRRAREIKLERKGFQRDAGGGYVRPSTKQTRDPEPAQPPSFLDKLTAAAEGSQAGLGALGASFNEGFAFGAPAKVMDTIGASSPEERAQLMAAEPAAAIAGNTVGMSASGIAGPEAAIARGTQMGANAARQAVPALAKTVPGRMAMAAGEGGVAGGITGGANALARGKSAEEAGRDALLGTAIGAGLGTAAQGAGEIKRQVVANKIPDLKQRVLNEVADSGNLAASATSKKRLQSAEDDILAEVMSGPDADAVRDAYLSGPAAGRKKLAPIIQGVGQENEAAYALFDQTGRSKLNVDDYLARIDGAIDDAVRGGQDRLATGLERFRERVAHRTTQSGGLTLTQARGLTTDAQNIAGSALGGLHEHASAMTARQVQGVVTGAMDDTLSAAATGIPQLEEAASTIRANNQRFHALLRIDDALKLKVPKEASQQTGLMSMAKDSRQVGAGGAVIGSIAGGGLGAAAGMAGEAALRHGIPAMARSIDKSLTTAAINQARGGGAGVASAARPAAAAVNPLIRARESERERDKKRHATLTGRK